MFIVTILLQSKKPCFYYRVDPFMLLSSRGGEHTHCESIPSEFSLKVGPCLNTLYFTESLQKDYSKHCMLGILYSHMNLRILIYYNTVPGTGNMIPSVYRFILYSNMVIGYRDLVGVQIIVKTSVSGLAVATTVVVEHEKMVISAAACISRDVCVQGVFVQSAGATCLLA